MSDELDVFNEVFNDEEVGEQQEESVDLPDKEEDHDADLPDKQLDDSLDESEENALEAENTDEKKSDGPDLLSELEKIRKERDEWAHRYKSDEGRFRAAQRKLQETDKSFSTKLSEALRSSERFKEFEEDYSDVAGVLSQYAEHIRENLLQEIQPTIEQLRQHQELSKREQEYAKLEQTVPGWREMVGSQEFQQWATTLPQYKREILANSTDAFEVASVLDDYKVRREVATLKQLEEEKRKKTKEKEKRLERSRTVTTRQGLVQESLPNDFDAVWEAIT